MLIFLGVVVLIDLLGYRETLEISVDYEGSPQLLVMILELHDIFLARQLNKLTLDSQTSPVHMLIQKLFGSEEPF